MNHDFEDFSLNDLETLVTRLEATKDYQKLERALRRLTELVPKSADHLTHLGWTLLQLRNFANAERAFREASAIPNKRRWEAFGGQGISLVKLKRFDEAVPILRKAIKGGFGDSGAKLSLVHALDQYRNHSERLALLNELVRARPDDANILFTYGKELTFAGKYAEAVEPIRRALSLNRNLPGEAYVNYAETLAAAGKNREAVDVLKSMLQSNFEWTNLHSLMSQCLERAFSAEQLRDVLLSAVARDPNDSVALFHLSNVLAASGELETADDAIQKCVILKADSAVAQGEAGRLAIRREQYQTARERFHRAWEITADQLRAEVNISQEPRHPNDEENIALNPVIYLGVEIASRDLRSRLVLTRFLAALGFTVVILSRATLNTAVSSLPRGIIVHKSINALDHSLITRAKSVGHILTTIDEEAFGWTGDPFGMIRVFDKRNITGCEAIFAPGQEYSQCISEQFPEAQSKLVVVGNPRTDLCDPRLQILFSEEAAAVHRQFGPMILLCTNFGGWNCAGWHYAQVCRTSLRSPGTSMDSAYSQWLLDLCKDEAETECRNTAAVREAIIALANAFPDHRIVVRPHPVEVAETWTHFASGIPNVVVTAESSLQAQVLAADVTIHVPGCGTGLEALLLNRPVISLDMVGDLKFPKLGISAHTSPVASDSHALIALVGKALREGSSFASLSEAQIALLNGCVSRSDELVCEQIATHLRKLYDRQANGRRKRASRESGTWTSKELDTVLSLAQAKTDGTMLSNVKQASTKQFRETEERVHNELLAIGNCLGMHHKIHVRAPASGIVVVHS